MMKNQPKTTLKYCPEDILQASEIKNPPFNNYGGPIWMDYSPGSYIDQDGKKVYKSEKKCEYVDKELIRMLFNKFIETNDEKYQKAIEYWLNN